MLTHKEHALKRAATSDHIVLKKMVILKINLLQFTMRFIHKKIYIKTHQITYLFFFSLEGACPQTTLL